MTNRLNAADLAAFRILDQAEKRANRIMMQDETTSRTVYGEEAPEYLAWCKAADAVRTFRAERDLLGCTIRKDGSVVPSRY